MWRMASLPLRSSFSWRYCSNSARWRGVKAKSRRVIPSAKGFRQAPSRRPACSATDDLAAIHEDVPLMAREGATGPTLILLGADDITGPAPSRTDLVDDDESHHALTATSDAAERGANGDLHADIL